MNFNIWPVTETIRCSSLTIFPFLLSDITIEHWSHEGTNKDCTKPQMSLWPSAGQWNVGSNSLWNSWRVTFRWGRMPFHFSFLLHDIWKEDITTGPLTASSDKGRNMACWGGQMSQKWGIWVLNEPRGATPAQDCLHFHFSLVKLIIIFGYLCNLHWILIPADTWPLTQKVTNGLANYCRKHLHI